MVGHRCLLGGCRPRHAGVVASVRHDGRSLAEIARGTIGPVAGTTASLAIVFIVVIALAGLGVVVVKALGGEEVKLPVGTVLSVPTDEMVKTEPYLNRTRVELPAGTAVTYPSGVQVTRSDDVSIAIPSEALAASVTDNQVTLPAGAVELVSGSSWGTFTIACTVPIALFVGLYMYRLRKGRVTEASILGAIAVLGATVAGNWIPGSVLEPYFSWSRGQTIFAICAYGFVASILPVWLLLCPRDYLSSFLKIGTVMLLVLGVIIANPTMEAPAVNKVFAQGGPVVAGSIFPFVFICVCVERFRFPCVGIIGNDAKDDWTGVAYPSHRLWGDVDRRFGRRDGVDCCS